MKRAAAIVTNRGGRTCHAAIIARELGIPAVVGCGDATDTVPDGTEVTVSCAEGDAGYVYEGALDFEESLIELDTLPKIPVKIMMNVGNPDKAFDFAEHSQPRCRPCAAGIHHQPDDRRASEGAAGIRTAGPGDQAKPSTSRWPATTDPVRFYIDKLAEGVEHHRRGVRSRTRHRAAVGFQVQRIREPDRWRALRAARGESDARLSRRRRATWPRAFGPASSSNARAIRKVRSEMGLSNVQVMVPFVRTVKEARAVVEPAGGERPRPGQGRAEDHHDVRRSPPTPCSPTGSWNISTACRSAPTT